MLVTRAAQCWYTTIILKVVTSAEVLPSSASYSCACILGWTVFTLSVILLFCYCHRINTSCKGLNLFWKGDKELRLTCI